ncbi:MAG: type I-E CRISPR-associated protein Cse1/CasA [Thermaerobacter sp.]|nr:type I-E CRISPR-associated protein Cse1/CasA [Thermaerobacter sp.]
MPSFNVLTDPWIVAQSRDGTLRESSLLEVLERAHELDSLVDAAPTIQLGLYRLLIAFVMDALDLREMDDVGSALARGRFAPSDLQSYADRVGRARFDLFDNEHPFLQNGGASASQEKTKSVAELFFHLPTGTNVVHFHHMNADDHGLSPAVCARALCALSPFMTSGGQGYSPSINGTPPWYVLIRGSSLFRTLLLNCYAATDLGLRHDAPPAWCSDQPVVPKQVQSCRSLLEGLTWRARSVRLLPGDGGVCTYSGKPSAILVRSMLFGPGFKVDGGNWTDPQVAYRTSEKGRLPMRPREDREVWRDTGPLLLLREADYASARGQVRFARPAVVDQLRQLERERYLDTGGKETYEVYGVRADKAKVFEWQYERLTLPEGIGRNSTAGEQAQQGIEMADSVARILGHAVKRAYPRAGVGNEQAFARVVQRAQSQYWSALKRRFTAELLQGLAEQDPDDGAARLHLAAGWNAALRKEGGSALEAAIGPLDSDAEALIQQQDAVAYFRREIARLLDPPETISGQVKRRREGQ